MDLMGQLGRMDKQGVLEFVKSCQHPSGGFGPNPDQDPHVLYTLSAIQVQFALAFPPWYLDHLDPPPFSHTHTHTNTHTQTRTHTQVLSLYDSVATVDCEGVVRFVAGLQQPDGSFFGDKWGMALSRNIARRL